VRDAWTGRIPLLVEPATPAVRLPLPVDEPAGAFTPNEIAASSAQQPDQDKM
jgi:hypothetical protein